MDLLAADGTVETASRPTRVVITTTDPKGKQLTFIGVARRGVLVFKTLAFKLTGTYTLHVTATGFQEAESDAFAVAASVVRRIVVTIQPASTTHDTPFTVQAELFDQFGNLAVDNSSTVTIVIPGRRTTATLGGTTSVIVSAGVADFSDLSIDVPARSYALEIVDGKLHATSKKFSIT